MLIVTERDCPSYPDRGGDDGVLAMGWGSG